MYKIIDNQGTGMFEHKIFKTKEDIRKCLLDFHRNDVQLEDNTRLEFLLEIGDWNIEEVDRYYLLKEIERREIRNLSGMSFDEVRDLICDWFGDEIIESESREDMINDYITDFMRYRKDEYEDELVELINKYK